MDLEKDSVKIKIDVDPSKTNLIGKLVQKLIRYSERLTTD